MTTRRSQLEPLRIVAIGGGTGLSSLLHGLKQYMRCDVNSSNPAANLDLTAVVTVTDDGGSSGRLRRDFAMMPPGDIRNCLVAMSEDEALLARLFQYRFDHGKGLKGHSLGNLFLTALTDLTGDFAKAVQHASEVLATCGRIFPSTSTNVVLQATLADGSKVEGETKISKSRARIERIRLKPGSVKPMQETLEAIANADLITFGPGSLFTSIIPNLLVKGIPEAIEQSPAIKLCFMNLMWQPGETIDFRASDHVEAIQKHAGRQLIDAVAVSTSPISILLKRQYAMQRALPVENDIERLQQLGARVIARPFASFGKKIRHDPAAIADVAIHLAGEGRRQRRRALKTK
ncbi:MAG TPA: uridine diphosphate-N-acetylglucosamine-binding protein YvcK [Bryobacteraceae bacterium]|nr:uridine diphosphate-N-acetylglucosamine-binding protein YvcK [Bryobacteraceae bacterium]